MDEGAVFSQEQSIELLAGNHPNGEVIIERVLVAPQAQKNCYLLLKSPVFVRGIARGDIIEQMSEPKGAFRIQQHAGNLCVRVFCKNDISELEQKLSIEIEKLGGDKDIQDKHTLIYSIHVSCGFTAIEKLFNEQLKDFPDAAWFYGNVYDPISGEPLNWWQPMLSPE